MSKNSRELVSEINRLREEKNAIILAHNYQRPEIQDIADFVADLRAPTPTASMEMATPNQEEILYLHQ